MKSVAIIGGGFAGLAAGVALADSGHTVTVLEYSRILGGRAYSVPDGTSGEPVDNGQHAILAAYRETRAFLGRLGTEPLIRYQKRFQVRFAESGGKRIQLRGFDLPSPLHLGAGVLAATGLSWNEKRHLLRAGLAIRWNPDPPPEMTVREWLDGLGQPDSLRARWWNPLATAALNEIPERASAVLFVHVLKLAFFGPARDSAFGIMTVPLGDLYTEQSRKFIESRNGIIRTQAGVARIVFSGNRVARLELRDGYRIEADDTISTVPPHSLERMLPPELTAAGGPFSMLRGFEASPILSFHLWYDRPILEEDFVGLVDSPIHWVFNKGALWREGKTGTGAVAAVVSAARDLIDRPREELTALCVSELKRFFPAARSSSPRHIRLIKERSATYSCTPETESLRPGARTPFTNFYLAGDWTRTGLPATIEGAVSSGHRCARLVAGDSAVDSPERH